MMSCTRTMNLAGNMQSEKGSATVPVALFGVSPNSWCGRSHSPFGAPRRVLPARRRDADGSGRDECVRVAVDHLPSPGYLFRKLVSSDMLAFFASFRVFRGQIKTAL